jgi:hypothetical protein
MAAIAVSPFQVMKHTIAFFCASKEKIQRDDHPSFFSDARIKSRSVALRHPIIQILPPCGMMSLEALKGASLYKVGRDALHKK